MASSNLSDIFNFQATTEALGTAGQPHRRAVRGGERRGL